MEGFGSYIEVAATSRCLSTAEDALSRRYLEPALNSCLAILHVGKKWRQKGVYVIITRVLWSYRDDLIWHKRSRKIRKWEYCYNHFYPRFMRDYLLLLFQRMENSTVPFFGDIKRR